MAVYALLLLVSLVLVDWGFQASGNTAAQDADIVDCLAPGHLDGLVSAAVSLGLAGAGSTPDMMRVGARELSVTEWRAADVADFQRACDAYAATSMPAQASAPQDGGVQTVLTILLPVIAGGLLTMAADDFKQASDRRWAQADKMRADWAEFGTAVRDYVRARRSPLAEGGPSPDELDTRRQTLAATLRNIRSQHRKSPTIRTLQENLLGELGPSISDGWDGGDSARAKQITDCLDAFGSSLERVAGALERRVWLSSKL
jgi:hypothetical protein